MKKLLILILNVLMFLNITPVMAEEPSQNFKTMIFIGNTYKEHIDQELSLKDSIQVDSIEEVSIENKEDVTWIVIETALLEQVQTLKDEFTNAQVILLNDEEVAKETSSFYFDGSEEELCTFLKENTITVEFYRNHSEEDEEVVEKTFTSTPHEEGEEETPHMMFSSELFKNETRELLGWSEEKISSDFYKKDALVFNSWIQGLKPRIKLYGQWKQIEPTETIEEPTIDNKLSVVKNEPKKSVREGSIESLLVKEDDIKEKTIVPQEITPKISIGFIDVNKASSNLSEYSKEIEFTGELNFENEASELLEKGYKLSKVPEYQEGTTKYYIELDHEVKTEESSEEKTYTRTIHYIFQGDANKNYDETQTVTLQRITTIKNDVVTGAVLSTNTSEKWLDGISIWNEVKTPQIDGYKASETKVIGQDVKTLEVLGNAFYNVYYTPTANTSETVKQTQKTQETSKPTLEPVHQDLRGKVVWTLTVLDAEGNIIGYRKVEDGGTALNMPKEYNIEDYSNVHGNKTISPRPTEKSTVPLPYTNDKSYIARWTLIFSLSQLTAIAMVIIWKKDLQNRW